MIYLDSSVVLAQILLEARRPEPAIWKEPLTSSRLLQYEVWTVLNARKENRAQLEFAQELLDRVDLVEMRYDVLERLSDPFPTPLRTLDAIHVATAEYLNGLGEPVKFASYDQRQLDVARKLGFELAEL